MKKFNARRRLQLGMKAASCARAFSEDGPEEVNV